MKRKNMIASLNGAFIFFLTILVTVTIAVSAFKLVTDISGTDMTKIYIVMLLVILFLSVLCTLADLLRRKIMVEKPAEEILLATEKIAQGDFSVRLVPHHIYNRYDEYDEIKENLNKMAQELEKSEMLKNDFISNVSHELKTPLAIIQNYSTLLSSDELSNEDRKKYAQTLHDASKRLTSLVTDILKLNKLENQNITPEKEKVRLHDSLAEAIIHFEELIDEKSLEIEADLSEVTIISIQSYLDIIWNNLISNAIKFTEKTGKISISLKNDSSRAVIKISDTGCGISKETGMRIFDKFYQGDTSHSQEGNGLGLALVKRIIDIIGGEISVESELGKGTTFTVILENLI